MRQKATLTTVVSAALVFFMLGALTGLGVRLVGRDRPAAADPDDLASGPSRVNPADIPFPPRVVSMSPPPGSPLPVAGSTLSVTLAFDVPGTLGGVECYGSLAFQSVEAVPKTAAWKVYLTSTAASETGAAPPGFRAIFRADDGRIIQCLWSASTPDPGAGGVERAGPRLIAVSPPGGSKLRLPPDGIVYISAQFSSPIVSGAFGMGGDLRAEDLTYLGETVRGDTLASLYKAYPGKEFWFSFIFEAPDGAESTLRWPGPIRTEPRTNTSPSLAWELHSRAWEKAIAEARAGDNVVRLGLYATRSLAVRHPEVYLKADRIFYETASRTDGFRELYEDNPPTWTYTADQLEEEHYRWEGMFQRGQMSGSPLNFRSLDLSRYRVVRRDQLFPDQVPPADLPLYHVVDQRVGALPVTLKRQALPVTGGPRQDPAVTSLELAFLRYFARGPSASTFIVFCEDESAYLWVEGVGLLDPATETRGQMTARPLIIFNEDYCWHLIMDRDDTALSPRLAAAVRDLGASAAVAAAFAASLSAEERQLLAGLREVTALGPGELPYAVWAASKARERSLRHEPYRQALAGVAILPRAGDPTSPGWYEFHITGSTFQMLSSRLTPLAAWIAAQEFENDLARARAVTGLYYDLARAGLWTTARIVWSPEFLWYDIEDSVLALAGTCAIQAGNVGALLDLAGVKNNVLWFGIQGAGGHVNVHLPEFGKEIENGYLHESEASVSALLASGKVVLLAVGHEGRFTAFSGPPFPSTMTGAAIEQVLTADAATFRQVRRYGDTGALSYEEVLSRLESEGVKLVDIP